MEKLLAECGFDRDKAYQVIWLEKKMLLVQENEGFL